MRKPMMLLLAALLVMSCFAPYVLAQDRNTLVIPGAPTTQFSYTTNNIGGFYGTNVFSALFKSTPDLQGVIPDLATDYTVSDDQLTFTFTIRDDAYWHDGVPFTPEDVKFNIEMALKCGIINGIYVSAFSCIEGAEEYMNGEADEISGITIDGNVVTIRMARPYGAFLNVLAQWMMLPKHLLEDDDPLTLHNSDFWQWPIGTGPYKVAEVAWGNYAILERNEMYYGKLPKIERIKMIAASLDRANDLIVAAQAGQIDYFNTNNVDVLNEVAKLKDYKVYPVDTYFMRYFIMNLDSPEGKNPVLSDVRVRKAILHAIDREAIVEAMFPNGEVTDTFVPAGYPDYWKEAEHYEYNPELARQLLDEAGFDYNYVLKLRYYYNDQATIDFMDLIVHYLSEVGIKSEHAFLEGDATTLIYHTRDHDIVYKGLSAFGYEEAYGEMISGGNIMTYLVNDNVYDELIAKLNSTVDPAARSGIIRELQKLDQEYLYRLPLFSLQNCIVVNTSRVKTAGVYGNEWWNYDRKIEEWEIID